MIMNNYSDWRVVFFDQAEDQFLLLDKNLNIQDANEAALKFYRKSRAEFVGKNIVDISPEVKSSGRHDKYMEVMQTGRTIVIDDVVNTPGHGNVCNRIKAFKVGDGLALAITNITDLKNIIDEIDTFSFQSSTDMKSPILSIQGLINAAKYDNTDKETVHEYYNLIHQQATRMNKIQERVLETMRIRSGGKTLDPVDFVEFFESIWNSLSYVEGFAKIKFNLKVYTKEKFFSDKHLLSSMFQNIFDNAIKYKRETSEGSYLNVSVIEDRKGIKIIIADNGSGIEERFQKDVFKMFFRASDKAKGSGLGLYTVNHCIKKLGGRIAMDSVFGEGTMFTICLPRNK